MATPNLDYADAAAVEAALDKAESALQVADLGVSITPASIGAPTIAEVEAYSQLKIGYEKGGIVATGEHEALVVPSPPEIPDEFTLKLPILSLPSWAPDANVVLFDAVSGSVGLRLTLTTAGNLVASIGDGVSAEAYQYTSTAIISFDAYTACEIAVAAKRASTLQFYVNGQPLGSEIDISGSDSESINGAKWRVLSDGTTHYDGFVYDSLVLASFLASEDIANRYLVPELWLVSGSVIPSYISNFESGTDGWASRAGVFVDGNKTAPDGTEGCLRVSAATITGSHLAMYDIVTSAGQKLDWVFEILIPDSNTNVSGVELSLLTSGQLLFAGTLGDGLSPGWNTIRANTAVTGDSTFINLSLLSATGSTHYTGAGKGSDDLFVRSARWGSPQTYTALSVASPGLQNNDLSDHDVFAYTESRKSAAGSVLEIRNTLTWEASSAAQSLCVDAIDALSESHIIERVYAKSTTGEHFTIGDQTDADRYFADGVVGSSWSEITLANVASDGTNNHILIQPTDGVGAPEARTDTLDIVVAVRSLA